MRGLVRLCGLPLQLFGDCLPDEGGETASARRTFDLPAQVLGDPKRCLKRAWVRVVVNDLHLIPGILPKRCLLHYNRKNVKYLFDIEFRLEAVSVNKCYGREFDRKSRWITFVGDTDLRCKIFICRVPRKSQRAGERGK